MSMKSLSFFPEGFTYNKIIPAMNQVEESTKIAEGPLSWMAFALSSTEKGFWKRDVIPLSGNDRTGKGSKGPASLPESPWPQACLPQSSYSRGWSLR